MIARLFTRRVLTRHLLGALVVLASIVSVRPGIAQTPSPGAILIAKQILQLKEVDKLFQPLVRGVIEKVKDQFLQTNFMWSKDLNEVAAQMQKEYAQRANELVDASARIYASHFTEAELRQILAFYQTPLGRKVITEEPKALDESMANAGNWGNNLSQEVADRMRAEMKKRGHDL